jgi:hypothetical protein
MNVQLIEPPDMLWQQVLGSARHDFYHLPSYVAFSAAHEGGVARAFYGRGDAGEFLLPVLIRRVPTELVGGEHVYDASSPYGYPAPIGTAGSKGLALFLRGVEQVAAESNVVTLFVRLHPLLPIPVSEPPSSAVMVQHAQTVYLDLSSPLETLEAGIRSGFRYDIRKLKQAGFSACFNQWQHFEAFVDLYHATMSRVSSSEFYMFPTAYFSGLREALEERVHLCTVHSPDGAVAAAGLFVETDGIVQYHLSGTATEFARLAPTKLMLHSAMLWARERGQQYLHLGGGVGSQNDSLFNFKAGFSRLRSEFHTYRAVCDLPCYQKLVDAHERTLGRQIGDTAYFPAYRAV